MAEAHDTLSQEAVRYGFTHLTAQHLAEFSKAHISPVRRPVFTDGPPRAPS